MRFGPVALDASAVGAILAHTQRYDGGVLKKGTVLSAEDVAKLSAAGVETVTAATFEPGDVPEDEAAAQIAALAAGRGVQLEPAFTGRSNLIATDAGVLTVDRSAIDALNRIDPAITFATLPAMSRVEAGRMVATCKIIPFAVPGAAMAAAAVQLREAGPPVSVAPFRARRIAVASTLLPTLKTSVVDKTLAVLERRLEGTGAHIIAEERVAHRSEDLAAALRRLTAARPDIVIVFGASAVVDRRDVIPAAIEAAGGAVAHFGMPVDPGNLLLLGTIGDIHAIGAPGCARSPKENGFDWVLDRLLAGIPVTPEDMMGMGVGGLLMEIVSRPQPRRAPEALPDDPRRGRFGAIVLAAGRSSRMGADNKLLIEVAGKPLVRHAVDAAIASRADPVVVVTGHQAEAVSAALWGAEAVFVHNPDFADGLATSLRAGLDALPGDCEAAVILLGDMPSIGPAEIDRMLAGYDPARGALIVQATAEGRPGHPVVWSRRFFDELRAVAGDQGGRALFGAYPDAVVTVELGSAAAADIDDPAALAAFRAAHAEV